MEDNEFWAMQNIMLTIIICTLILSITYYWVNHNTKIVELIKNGVPAIEVMCAMQNDYGDDPICMVIAAKEK